MRAETAGHIHDLEVNLIKNCLHIKRDANFIRNLVKVGEKT